MEDAPKAFQINENYIIKIKDDEYMIFLTFLSSSLEIKISLKKFLSRNFIFKKLHFR